MAIRRVLGIETEMISSTPELSIAPDSMQGCHDSNHINIAYLRLW